MFNNVESCNEIYRGVLDLYASNKQTKIAVRAIADIAYNYDVNSFEFIEGMDIIKELNAFKGSILCLNRQVEKDVIPQTEITRLWETEKWNNLLSPNHTFGEIGFFNNTMTFKKRSDVEYDVRYRQVCVGSLITDGFNIICLKTNDRGRLPNMYTLVQGHVDFDKSAYTTSQVDYIKGNAMRELYEEIDLVNPTPDELLLGVPFNSSIYPDYFLNTKRTLTNLEHVGFVYILRVADCKEAINLITSKEPNKHEVVLLPLEPTLGMDNWLELVVTDICKFS
jgi:predicted NUDIX family phosphoesterase